MKCGCDEKSFVWPCSRTKRPPGFRIVEVPSDVAVESDGDCLNIRSGRRGSSGRLYGGSAKMKSKLLARELLI